MYHTSEVPEKSSPSKNKWIKEGRGHILQSNFVSQGIYAVFNKSLTLKTRILHNYAYYLQTWLPVIMSISNRMTGIYVLI